MLFKIILLIIFLGSSTLIFAEDSIIDCVLIQYPELYESNPSEMKKAIEKANDEQDQDLEHVGTDLSTLGDDVKSSREQYANKLAGTDKQYCTNLSKSQKMANEIFEEYIDCNENVEKGDRKKLCTKFEDYSDHALATGKAKDVSGTLKWVKKISAEIVKRKLERKIALRLKTQDSIADEDIAAFKAKKIIASKVEEGPVKVQPVLIQKPIDTIKPKEDETKWFANWLKSIWASFIAYVVSIINFFKKIL